MGLYIKKSNKGIRIFHSVNDEPIHDGFLKTADEVKSVFVERALQNFFQEVVKIEKDFLSGYEINGKRKQNSNNGLEFILKAMQTDNYHEIEKEAKKVIKRLKVRL